MMTTATTMMMMTITIMTTTKMMNMMMQVGPPRDGYVLTVGGFNNALSTLGDSMRHSNGMMFTTK